MEILKVVIDPGHGGKDSGAVKGDFIEAKYNYEIAQKVQSFCEKNLRSLIQISLSRGPNEDPGLTERAKRFPSNDLTICLHCNAGPENVAGAFVFYKPYFEEDKKVAEHIIRHMPTQLQRTKVQATAATKESWGRVNNVLSPWQCPSVLIEMGFITNYGDRELLNKEEIKNDIVKAIVAGIIEFLIGRL